MDHISDGDDRRRPKLEEQKKINVETYYFEERKRSN
jgi:hypothetical protein